MSACAARGLCLIGSARERPSAMGLMPYAIAFICVSREAAGTWCDSASEATNPPST